MENPSENKTDSDPSCCQPGSEAKSAAACPFCCKVDFKFVMARAREILTNPDGCWQTIKEDPRNLKQTYQDYLLVLAAIPAIASFLKATIIGFSFRGASVHTPFFAGLIQHILLYAIYLATPWIGAFIMEKLAPKFEAQCDRFNAFKLLAYASTPAYIAGFFILFGATLGFVVGLAGLALTVALLLKGLPQMMTVPEANRNKFLAISVVATIVAVAIAAEIAGSVAGNPGARPGTLLINGQKINLEQMQRMVPRN